MDEDNSMSASSLTKYPDVNEIIDFFVRGIFPAIEGNVLGIYLTGSLSYGAFNYHSSDIDITVIVHRPVSQSELDSIGRLHREMEGKFEKWARRLECSYTPVDMLSNVMPPTEPRPWYWGGDFTLYEEAPYGNEWIINNYFLHRHSIALFGPSFKKLLPSVDIEDVRKACVRDLFQEWVPKKSNPEYLRDSHHEAYFILNLCRILHTVICSVVGSKKMAASWVQENYGERWRDLVGSALAWQYGVELDGRQEAIDFLDFAISEVSKTEVYRQVINAHSILERMKMKVVTARKSDIPAILEIWKELMDFHVPFDSRYTLSDGAEESMGENLARLIEAEDALVIMAVENTKVLGYGTAKIGKYPPVFVKQTCGTIEDLAVSSEHRRRGIGELMLKEMLDWFQSQGIDRVELRVASMNTVGYSFWRKHGFTDYMHIMYRDLPEVE